jgi:methyl-accepting chemotaxis protein
MDLNHANMKHEQWKVKFRSAIVTKQTLDAAAVSADNHCDFGQWLQGDAKTKYGHLPSHSSCVSAHAAFHAEAGKVASIINAKNFDEAEKMLGFGSHFALTSSAVTRAIHHLQKEVHAHTGIRLGDAVMAES